MLLQHHEVEARTALKQKRKRGDTREVYRDIPRRLTLQRYISNWRDAMERSRSGEKKADYYFRFNQLERSFNVWKRAARAAKEKRRAQEEANEKAIEEAKQQRASESGERNIQKKFLRTWKARTRDRKETRRLSELGRQRAEARVKVDQFLDSLKQLRRDLRSDVDRLGKKKKPTSVSPSRKKVGQSRATASGILKNSNTCGPAKENTVKTKSTRIQDRIGSTSASAGSKMSAENFYDRWGLDAKPPKRDPSPPTGPPTATMATTLPPQLKDKKIELQKMVIDEQRNRLRKQRKEIDNLRELRAQLDAGRAVTNQALLRSLSLPLRETNVAIRSRDVLDLRHSETAAMTMTLSMDQYNLQLTGRRKDRTQTRRVAVAAANSLDDDDDDGRSSDDIGDDDGRRAKLWKDKRQEEVLSFHRLMAAERRRKLSEAAVRLARETEEGEAAMKEEMRARKEAAEAKRKDDERRVKQMQEAESFARRRTMRAYGMRPWLKLMADRRLGEFLAENHRYEREARKAMAAIARFRAMQRESRADIHHESALLRKVVRTWKSRICAAKMRGEAAGDCEEVDEEGISSSESIGFIDTEIDSYISSGD